MKRSLIFACIFTVGALIAVSYLRSYATPTCKPSNSACSCIDLPDIKAFYDDQVAQQQEYNKTAWDYSDYSRSDCSWCEWNKDGNDQMMEGVNQAVTDAFGLNPGANHVGAGTNPVTCSIGDYQTRAMNTIRDGINGYPCLKELVDAHEQVHVDACDRLHSYYNPAHWNYKFGMTMAQVAEEEVRATEAGKNHAKSVANDLELQCCCKLTKPLGGTARLSTIIKNLLK